MEFRFVIPVISLLLSWYSYAHAQNTVVHVRQSSGTMITNALTFSPETFMSFYTCLKDNTNEKCNAAYNVNYTIVTVTPEKWNGGGNMQTMQFSCVNIIDLNKGNAFLCTRSQFPLVTCDPQVKYQPFRSRSDTNSACPGIVWTYVNERVELSAEYEFCNDGCASTQNTQMSSSTTQMTTIATITNAIPVTSTELNGTTSEVITATSASVLQSTSTEITTSSNQVSQSLTPDNAVQVTSTEITTSSNQVSQSLTPDNAVQVTSTAVNEKKTTAAPRTSSQTNDEYTTKYIIIGVVVGGVSLIILCIILVVIICKCRRDQSMKATHQQSDKTTTRNGNTSTHFTNETEVYSTPAGKAYAEVDDASHPDTSNSDSADADNVSTTYAVNNVLYNTGPSEADPSLNTGPSGDVTYF